ncbi:MAG: JAB domain-containing protein [Crocinitomicaceae bacterium]
MNRIAEIKVSYINRSKQTEKITCSSDAHQLFMTHWDMDIIDLQEEFKILLLNRANKVLGIHNLSKGGVSGTIADAKIIFSVALKCNASAIILAHNHPSGNLKPSEQDKRLTKNLFEAGKMLEMAVVDHLIITSNGYFSFAEDGLIQ